MSLMKLDLLLSILRTFFEAEAETLIPPLVFASVMMLKPAFHRWRFKIVRTVDYAINDLMLFEGLIRVNDRRMPRSTASHIQAENIQISDRPNRL